MFSEAFSSVGDLKFNWTNERRLTLVECLFIDEDYTDDRKDFDGKQHSDDDLVILTEQCSG
jgi:hypothetical protein